MIRTSRDTCRPWGFIALVLVTLFGSSALGTETNFLSRIRLLTLEGRRAGEGYFSSDGRHLVFQSEREPGNPFYQIYTLDLESGESRRVSPGTGKTTCAFFRPGTDQIIFASTHLDPSSPDLQKAEFDLRASGKQRRYAWDYDEQMDLFVAKRDGSDVQRLTDTLGYDAEASYSPDGQLIVFCSLRDAYPTNRLSSQDAHRLVMDPAYFGEIYLMNADGSNPRRLTRKPGYDGGPFFSHDGQRIVWRRFDEKGTTADVHTMALDGSDERRLTDFGSMSWAPYFHPSGAYVIFTSNKLGFDNFELFMVDALGKKEPVRITHTPGFDGLPVFAPDGRQLCWTSARTADARSQLFMAQWDHAAALQALASAPARNPATPATSPTETRSPQSTPASVAPVAIGAFSPDIRAGDMRQQVGFLASTDLGGRLTGSPGARLAAEYIRDHLRRAGLQPMSADWLHEFEFTAGTEIVTNENHLSIESRPFEVNRHFRPLPFSANGTVTGPVAFAGYGLRLPGKPGEGYDSYAGLDVSNKVVLVLRYVPEDTTPERRIELNRYAGLPYKAMLARDLGAKAILVVSGPNSPNPGELANLSSDGNLSGSGILAASIDLATAESLLAGSGHDLKTLQSGLDSENPHALGSFDITNRSITLTTQLKRIRKRDRNVVGWIPPRREDDGIVLLGAHYDHLGRGEASGAFNRKGEEGQVCAGADDNASGVSVLLEVAANLARRAANDPTGPHRGVAFAFWSGEEIGLLGSSHFAEHGPVKPKDIVAYLNFDMVGRLRNNRLMLQGIGSSSAWKRLIEKRNVAAGFDLVLQDDPFLPTDTTPFYTRRIPILAFFTGSHDDYHRPTDQHDKLDYEGMERIATFASRLTSDLRLDENRPAYVEVARSTGNMGSRDSLRAFLGTIPDYASEVEGVKLSGVRSGSPADQAGMKGGDVIISLAGKKIANIYDYTYALDAVKIGQPVEIVIRREGQTLNLKVTPVARK